MVKRKRQASESLSLTQASENLSHMEDRIRKTLVRLVPLLPAKRLRILEIGAAQGRGLIALAQLGHEAVGLEPHRPALEVAKKLSEAKGLKIELAEGRAEKIPFDDGEFDLVLAFSVMEHVTDLEASLLEINRVLKPGGVFWFNSASSLCPRQKEISVFPLFGWYPDKLKRYIMHWAVKNRPGLVGYTEHPAIHWWTPQKARRKLREAGFSKVLDRWDLRNSEEDSGVAGMLIAITKNNKLFHFVGDIVIPGCSFAAQK
jgi:ubiquinone/menaquinone biosynthesis C-methylase UbiE